jgi:hypothetical protein
MALNFDDGKPIAVIKDGKCKGNVIYIAKEDKTNNVEFVGTKKIDLKKDSLSPILNPDERTVAYIAGPAGSGKTTMAVTLAESFKKLFPKRPIYLFSRTDYRKDPAYKKLKVNQIKLDDSLVTDPIDLTEIEEGSLIMFDDTNTLMDRKVKEAVDALICSIMEVGRKLSLYLILTSHLINPNDRKFGRTCLNEMQQLTVFPSSGSAYQIRYCLKQYYGLDNKQIEAILKLPSRWVTISKTYPMCVLYEHGVYLL